MGSAESSQSKTELKKLIAEQENAANLLIAKLLFLTGGLGLIVWLVYRMKIWIGNLVLVNLVYGGCSVLLIILSSVILMKKGKGKYSKFLLFTVLLLFIFGVNISAGYCDWIAYTFPLLLTCRYVDRKLTTVIFSISEIGIFVSGVINSYGYRQVGYLDLNTAILPAGTTLQASETGELFRPVVAAQPDSAMLFKNTLIQSTIPQLLLLGLFFLSCLALQRYSMRIMLKYGQMEKEKADLELEMANSRSGIMLSQIQPHFLYNALQAIMEIDGNPDETVQALGDFGKYLRENMDMITSDDLILFRKELTHVQRYVSLEKLRFGSKIRVEYDIQTDSFYLPSMTVQVLVENAIRHGISKKQNGGIVRVHTREEENTYVILVEDNGPGFDPSKGIPQDGKSYMGIENLEARIKNLCGGTFEIESAVGKGTITIVRLPKAKAI